MRRIGFVVPLLTCFLLALGAIPTVAPAAQGDLVGQVRFDQPCPSGIGVGIAFDGDNLWYSCYNSNPDLYKADPITGHVTATYNIAGGLGALAFDRVRQIMWAGWGRGGLSGGNIYKIQIDRATKTVTSSAVAFNANDTYINTIDDGLAYDHEDNTLYISGDVSTVVHHYAVTGAHLSDGPNGTGDFAWAGSGCYNSGLAIGGDLLYEGSDGCVHIWVVNKRSPTTRAFDFSSPGTRDEDLECDPETFAGVGKHVMWSKDAYTPFAYAFEIPFGSCGFGGLEIRHDTSTTYTGDLKVQYSDAASLSARVRDTSTSPDTGLEGKTVTFKLGSQTATAGPTDADGVASTSLVVNQQPGSASSIDTSIKQDAIHKQSSDSDTFEIVREDCSLSYSGDTTVLPHASTNLSADMGELDSSLGDRSNKTVDFRIQDGTGGVTTVQATTDANGHASTTQPLAPGTYHVTAKFAGDPFYNVCQSAEQTVIVKGLPPDCSTAVATPSTLAPPNHKFRLVTVSGASDPEGESVSTTITSVTQDEPVNDVADGNTAPDAWYALTSNQVWLIAERRAGGDGRVYRVSFRAVDETGESCTGVVTVGVDKNPAKPAIDSAPPSYDSFGH
jgi:hypothetical protein